MYMCVSLQATVKSRGTTTAQLTHVTVGGSLFCVSITVETSTRHVRSLLSSQKLERGRLSKDQIMGADESWQQFRVETSELQYP